MNDKFKQGRKSLNLTQGQLAALLGVSRRQVLRYENGHQAVPGPVSIIMRGLLTGRWPKV